MLTIIGGRHRGRKLQTLAKDGVRPTSSKARGAIFNILMHGALGPRGVEGSLVADVFCGTGALGLEALSRGATRVTFIDQAKESIALAERNAAHLQEEANCRFLRLDATLSPKSDVRYTLAFLDPPYRSSLAVPALERLHQQGWLASAAVLVVEINAKEPFSPPLAFEAFDNRLYGDTRMILLRYKGDIA